MRWRFDSLGIRLSAPLQPESSRRPCVMMKTAFEGLRDVTTQMYMEDLRRVGDAFLQLAHELDEIEGGVR